MQAGVAMLQAKRGLGNAYATGVAFLLGSLHSLQLDTTNLKLENLDSL